jgi:hypothetical protein
LHGVEESERRRSGRLVSQVDLLPTICELIRWNDGFEELYDYENEPDLLDGTINTRANAEDLRQRLETMRVSAGDATGPRRTSASERDSSADPGPPAGGALDPERPTQTQRPLAHRVQPKVSGEVPARIEAHPVV